MISKQQARALVRKAVKRVPEGEEIRHLNIMPMMDIMTILLVAYLFQAAQSAALSVGSVNLPGSQTFDPPPESAVTLTIAKEAILVEGRPVITVKQGDVDASEKKGGTLGIEIPKISRFLGAVRQKFEADLKAKGRQIPSTPELLIIADKQTPYKLLFSVMATSVTEEAGFKIFRLIVLQKSEEG